MQESEVSNVFRSLAESLAGITHPLVLKVCEHNPCLHPYNSPSGLLPLQAISAVALIHMKLRNELPFPA